MLKLKFNKGNIERVISQLENDFPAAKATGRKKWRIDVNNSAPYAVYLHNRAGYFVFNPGYSQKIAYAELRRLSNLKGFKYTDKNVEAALNRIGKHLITWHTAFISGYQTVPAHLGARRRRRGRWADRTGLLAQSYSFTVKKR